MKRTIIPGDRVKIVGKNTRGTWNSDGKMDWTFGEVGTVVHVTSEIYYSVEFENDQVWTYAAEEISLYDTQCEIEELEKRLGDLRIKKALDDSKKFEVEFDKVMQMPVHIKFTVAELTRLLGMISSVTLKQTRDAMNGYDTFRFKQDSVDKILDITDDPRIYGRLKNIYQELTKDLREPEDD